MSQVLVGGGRVSAITSGFFSQLPANIISNATESFFAFPIGVAGTFSHFGGSFNANGTARSVRLRKNSANANCAALPADSTQQVVYDDTTTDHFAATDTIDIQYNSTGTAPVVYFTTSVFQADVGHCSLYIGRVSGATPTFTTLEGPGSATETDTQDTMRAAGTLQNVSVGVATATTSTGTLVSRVNGVTKSISVSITANTTGVFQDTSHSDAFVAGDKISFQTSGHSSGLSGVVQVVVSYSSVAHEVIGGCLGANAAFSASNQFYSICAGAQGVNTTEAVMKQKHKYDGTCSNMRQFVQFNNWTGAATVNIRKNGANGNQSISLTASTTGLFEDSTHSDTFLANDDMNYMISGGSSGTTLSLWMIMLTEKPQPPVVFPSDDNAVRIKIQRRAIPVG